MNEFRINELILLKFRYPATEIYVNGKYFKQCKRLVLNILKSEIKNYSKITSVDEATEFYDHYIYEHEILKEDGLPKVVNDENFTLIKPEEEFWGHCSNLQAWVENNYESRFLKANLAFPLLKKLAEAGDNLAQIKFKEEILKRLSNGPNSVQEYLFFEGYQDFLSNEELLFGLLEPTEAEILLKIQKKLNVVFKFAPSIDSNIGYKPPINLEEIRKIRVFSIESKCVKGLELKFNEMLKLPIETYNLNKLKRIRMNGKFSDLSTTKIIDAVRRFKFVKEIFLRSSLVQTLENTSLKNIKKIGKKIVKIYGV